MYSALNIPQLHKPQLSVGVKKEYQDLEHTEASWCVSDGSYGMSGSNEPECSDPEQLSTPQRANSLSQMSFPKC